VVEVLETTDDRVLVLLGAIVKLKRAVLLKAFDTPGLYDIIEVRVEVFDCTAERVGINGTFSTLRCVAWHSNKRMDNINPLTSISLSTRCSIFLNISFLNRI
jgi:hypothetical protein